MVAFLSFMQSETWANEVEPIEPQEVEKLLNSDHCLVIVSFVTSRCSACRREMPIYQEMFERYKDQGLGLFVISLDFGYPNAIQKIVDQEELTYPVFWGGEEVMQAYDISVVPYKLLVQNDTEKKTTGGWSKAELEDKINELLRSCRE
ncbi:MAG: peroxiredoxin family protein [Desulfovermiculus sp.]